MQRKHYKVDVFRKIASFEEAATLRKGDTLSRPYRSTLVGQDYSRGTAFTVQDLTDTEETLTVQTAKIVPFYVDDLDALQSNYKTANKYADDAAVVLGNLIDGDVLGEYDQASNSVDDEDINGGTAGNGFILSTSNIDKVFVQAGLKLDEQNVGADDRFAVISPRFEAVLRERLAGKESALGDSTGMNGHIGKYMGFQLYKSNAVGWSAELALATNPTADDTITINGVVLTFKASPSAAGEIDVAASADATRALLAEFINAGGATSSSGEYVALSAANQAKWKGLSATNNDSTNVLSVKAEGKNFIVVSETLTDGTDTWTAAKQIQHNLFGRKGAIELVIQQAPKLEVKDVPDKLGKNFAPWTLYGLKTFSEGAVELVDVMVRSDQFAS